MRRLFLCLLLLGALPAAAAEISVLSAGAMEPGLERAAAGFRQATGEQVRIAYATAPQLRLRIEAGQRPDLLIAPAGLIRDLAATGRLAGESLPLGRVGVGIAVRQDAPLPEIQDEQGLREALRSADSVVFNRASTGLYLDRLFERMGLAAAIAPKAHRYATGAEVMEHLLHGSGREIGFGASTEILMVPGLRLIGPLPPGLQNYTTYSAALLPGASGPATALLRYLAGPAGRAALEAGGVAPPQTP
ncbi:MAG: substrate-binding domain-containing protein [Acetobacteraceae bacterium]|nr:substrate-binding domain-containing protein [Acetobacteraceae bacterium]